MPTEKQILMRITSTSNIAKITKSMKMVSAAKMRGAQSRLNQGTPFCKWLDTIGSKPIVAEDSDLSSNQIGRENMMIPISSDRGLCGGCNSYVAKATKSQMDKFPSTASTSMFIIGEKGRSQLRRQCADHFKGSVAECWQTVPSFAMASSIAEGVLASNQEHTDKAHIVFNKFISAISYSTSIRTINLNPSSSSSGELDSEMSQEDDSLMMAYEVEPDNREEVMTDLAEFQLATGVFHGMIESNTSEESSRMAAMENATNNAEELIQSLTLSYNKARQTRITTELIEIISGAASLDG